MPYRREIKVLGRVVGTTRSHFGSGGGRYSGVRLNERGLLVFGVKTQRLLDIEGSALIVNLYAGTATVELDVPRDNDECADTMPDSVELKPNWLLLLMEPEHALTA